MTDSRIHSRVVDLAMITTSICAIIVTGLLVFRALSPPRVSGAKSDSGGPLSDSLWKEVRAGGHLLRPVDSLQSGVPFVTLVVFSDFECPFCAVFATSTLPTLQDEFKDQLHVIFRHWPLPNHRSAVPAALAAECAGDQGRFTAFHDRLFNAQDSIGYLGMDTIASQAGVPDLARFAGCFSSGEFEMKVRTDGQLALSVGGSGTPTVLLEGRRLRAADTDRIGLSRLISTALEVAR